MSKFLNFFLRTLPPSQDFLKTEIRIHSFPEARIHAAGVVCSPEEPMASSPSLMVWTVTFKTRSWRQRYLPSASELHRAESAWFQAYRCFKWICQHIISCGIDSRPPQVISGHLRTFFQNKSPLISQIWALTTAARYWKQLTLQYILVLRYILKYACEKTDALLGKIKLF